MLVKIKREKKKKEKKELVWKFNLEPTTRQAEVAEGELRGLSRKLYRPSDIRCLSAKLVPSFADRRCHVVSVTDPYGRILGILD
jgi:CBS-domain-containing membrane protein